MRTLFYNIASLIFLLTNFITVSGQERPQTPIPPFPYQSIEVSYVVKADTAVRLAASLTIPEGKGPFPAVLIIGGSGQVTRDQPFYNHKTMWVLADFLTRNGFATLRFDDRGAGKSTAGTKKQSELLEADLVADAAAGFDFLRQHPSIDPSKIGIIGHSAGARQGVEIASQEERNAYFAIMLAGAVESFPHDIVAHQSKLMNRAAGRSATAQKADSSFMVRSIYYTINEPSYEKRKMEIRRIADEELQKISVPEREVMAKGFYTRVNILSSEQFHKAAQVKQEDWLLKIKCPVLIINGDLDLNVDAKIYVPKMAASLKKNYNKKSNLYVLHGINHMLQQGKTGLSEESNEIKETINPEILDIIGKWLYNLESF